MDSETDPSPGPGKLALGEGDVRPACVAALRRIVGHASRRLVAPDIGPAKRVHEYRKAMRRARSLMRILRPSLSKRRSRDLERPIADGHRRQSAARDDTMRLVTWHEFATRHHCESDAVNRGLVALADTARTPRGSTNAELEAVFEELFAALPLEMSTDDLRLGLQATYKSARRQLRRVENVADPVHVHALRRRIKDLAYQSEFLTPLSKRAGRWRVRWGELASALGEVTDLYILRDSLDRVCAADPSALSPSAKRDIDRAIDRDIETRLEATLPVIGHALERRPAKFARRFGL